MLDEVVRELGRLSTREVAIDEGARMLAFPNLLTAPVRREEMRLALALLARHTSLEPRDAIHAAVAIRQGVRKIVSDDPDFDLIREQKRIPLA